MTTLNTKKIVFIRHVQSEENVKFAAFCACLSQLKRFTLPTSKQALEALLLLRFNPNSSISNLGAQQVKDIQSHLRNIGFWDEFRPKLLLHSNLQRTKQTLHGILPDIETYEGLIHELSCLCELLYYEYVYPYTVYQRQERFKQYLDSLSIECDRILVVGHGRYFKLLMNMESELRNGDVVEVSYRPSSSPNAVGSFDSSTYKMIYRCPLSTPAASELLSESHQSVPSNNDQTSTEQEEEPSCRICQMTRSETPDMRLIRPCKCSGSLSYVHVECLNQWRSTSITAQYECSVCKYQYQFERTLLAALLLSETGAIMISCTLLSILILFVGLSTYGITNYYQAYNHNYHPVNMFYKYTSINPWWIECSRLIRSPTGFTVNKSLQNYRSQVWKLISQMSLRERFRYVYNYGDEQNLQLVLFCYPNVLPSMNILESGIIFVSLIGFFVFMLHEFSHGRIREYLFFVGIWLSPIKGSQLGRLVVGFGFLITAYHMYNYTSSYARRIGQYLGERILEPNH